MRYCDNCGGIAGSKLTVPGETPERPRELFYCDERCKTELRRRFDPTYVDRRRESHLQLVASAARSVS